ncbi:MAG: copper-binding protein [Acidobacteria bacterium]|nr:copper-binding protein [Acidobacteriota bacterium]
MNAPRFVLAAVLPMLLVGCVSKPPAPVTEKRHEIRGEVLRLNAKDKVAMIKHGEIKDFMEAMTMGFEVREDAQWAKLREGMQMKGIIVELGQDYWLTAVEEVPARAPAAPPAPKETK